MRDPGNNPARTIAADKVLQAAVRQLADDGFELGLVNISMEKAIAEAGVSRATAYRRWPDRGAFASDVLVEAVRIADLAPESSDELAEILALLIKGGTGLVDERERRSLIVEGLRISLSGDIARLARSRQWNMIASLSALHPALPPGEMKDEIGAALRQAEQRFDAQRASVYRNVAVLTGYRLAEPWTEPDALAHDVSRDGGEDPDSRAEAQYRADGFDDLAATMGALMRGVVLRSLPDPEWLQARTPARLFGSTVLAQWSTPERMLARVLLMHLEPDPKIVWDEAFARARVAEVRDLIDWLFEAQPHEASGPLS